MIARLGACLSATLALVALASALVACSSAPPPAARVHPYRVVLLPVEGASVALAEPPQEDDVPFALDAKDLGGVIRDRLVAANVFSDVLRVNARDLPRSRGEDEMQAAAAYARLHDADLILRVHVKSARLTDLGNNGSTLLSTFLWTMIPAPVWWTDDRTYATNFAVQAELFDLSDPVKPTATVVASSGTVELDLWDRGPNLFVAVVPPPLLAGSTETVSAALTERVLDEVLEGLVNELRDRDIPSRFELTVTREGAMLRVAAASRRDLRSLDVLLDGRPLQSWAETALVPDESTQDRLVYERSVALPASGRGGSVVRVVAEDETGGREVRTLLVEDGR